MKNLIIGLLIGSVFGGGAGYFVARKVLEKKFEEAYQVSKDNSTDTPEKIDTPEDISGAVNDGGSLTKAPEKADLEKYSKIVKESKKEEPAPEPEKPAKKTTSKKEPKVISEKDYDNEESYMTDELRYYEEDDLLVDANDEPVNPEDYIGVAGMDALAETTSQHVYVKNPKFKTCYDVEVIHGRMEDEE